MSYAAPSPSAGRIVGLGLVILLHIALVYALVTGLAFRAVEVVRGADRDEDHRGDAEQHEAPPPPPPPTFTPPPPAFVPPPEVHIATPPPRRRKAPPSPR